MKNELCPSQIRQLPITLSSDFMKLTFGFHLICFFSFRCGLGENLHFRMLPIPGFQWCWRLKNFPLAVGLPLQCGLTVCKSSFFLKVIVSPMSIDIRQLLYKVYSNLFFKQVFQEGVQLFVQTFQQFVIKKHCVLIVYQQQL